MGKRWGEERECGVFLTLVDGIVFCFESCCFLPINLVISLLFLYPSPK